MAWKRPGVRIPLPPPTSTRGWFTSTSCRVSPRAGSTSATVAARRAAGRAQQRPDGLDPRSRAVVEGLGVRLPRRPRGGEARKRDQVLEEPRTSTEPGGWRKNVPLAGGQGFESPYLHQISAFLTQMSRAQASAAPASRG